MPDRTRIQSLSALLIGAWLAFSVAMTVAATVNFAHLKPEKLRDSARVFGKLGDEETQKVALRYAASELNRLLFDLYGKGQLLLGAAATVSVLFLRRGRIPAILLLLAFVSALYFQFRLVPAITEQGRVIDFMPREPKGPEVQAFDRLHRTSVRVEGGKMLILLGAAVLLGRMRREGVGADS